MRRDRLVADRPWSMRLHAALFGLGRAEIKEAVSVDTLCRTIKAASQSGSLSDLDRRRLADALSAPRAGVLGKAG